MCESRWPWLKEMHAASGEVGGAEAKLVLTEKDVARLRAAGPEKMHRAMAILGPADPLVLRAAGEGGRLLSFTFTHLVLKCVSMLCRAFTLFIN